MTASPPPFLCIGAAHWDVVGRTAAALPPGADVPGRVTGQPGGVAQNIARALAALGRPVRLIAALGRDPIGDALASDLTAAGVDCSWLHRHPGATDSYVAIEGADGALHAAVAEAYPPRQPVDLVALADLLSTTVEGGIVMSKALGEPRLLGKQIMLQRGYIKLLFCPN